MNEEMAPSNVFTWLFHRVSFSSSSGDGPGVVCAGEGCGAWAAALLELTYCATMRRAVISKKQIKSLEQQVLTFIQLIPFL
jgi:hypothetical protein